MEGGRREDRSWKGGVYKLSILEFDFINYFSSDCLITKGLDTLLSKHSWYVTLIYLIVYFFTFIIIHMTMEISFQNH